MSSRERREKERERAREEKREKDRRKYEETNARSAEMALYSFIGRIITKPVLLPVLLISTGMYYGVHEVVFIPLDVAAGSVAKRGGEERAGKIGAHLIGLSFLALRMRGMGASLTTLTNINYHVSSLGAAGSISALSRIAFKYFLQETKK